MLKAGWIAPDLFLTAAALVIYKVTMSTSGVAATGGIDPAATFRGAGVPNRAINGDLWPTDTAGNRAVTPDFDAVIMKDAGHYPMIERPDEFNRLLAGVVAELERKVPPATPAS